MKTIELVALGALLVAAAFSAPALAGLIASAAKGTQVLSGF